MPQQISQGVETEVVGSSPNVRSYDPTIFALSNGNFVIINRNNQYGVQNFVGTVYNADNELLKIFTLQGSYVFASNLQTPEIIETDTGFAVGYSTDSNRSDANGSVQFELFDYNGNSLPSSLVLIDPNPVGTGGGQPDRVDVDLAFTADKHIVAVFTKVDPNTPTDPNIAIRVFDAAGNPLTATAILTADTSGSQTAPKATALTNGNVVVTFSESGFLSGQIVDSLGNRVGTEFGIAGGGNEVVEIFARANGFTAYWRATDGTFHQRDFDSAGVPTGADIVLPGVNAAGEVNVAPYQDGGAIVSWGSYAQVFDRSGTAVSDPVYVVNPQGGTLTELMAVQLADGSLMSAGIFPLGGFSGSAAITHRAELFLGPKPQDQTGTSGTDWIAGDARDNVLNGSAGNDYLYGLAGNDTILPGLGGGLAYGGAGIDTFSFAGLDIETSASLVTNAAYGYGPEILFFEFENLTGGSAKDTLQGDDNANRLDGAAGNDILITGKGGDTVIGGSGTDTVSYIDSNGTVVVNLTLGKGYNNYADSDTYSGIENVFGSSYADILIGDEGSNRLTGSFGNDTLIGGLGADVLDGQGDADTVEYSDSIGTVFVNLTLGRGYNNSAEGDVYVDVENVTGSAFADFVIGDAGANRIDGAGGNDTLIGALGADVLVGGAGSDIASYEDNQGAVFVNLASGQGFGNAAQGDTYQGIENVAGSIYNDYLIGDSAANVLTGGAGDDILIGGLGADTLAGGAGFDTASYEDNWGAVFVNLLTGAGASNAAQGDGFDSIEGLVGSVFYDTFIGNDVRNVLNGKRGADTLTGNGGNDDFVFDTPIDGQMNVDHITDFTSGQDRIVLDNAVFFTLSDGALQANNLVFGTEATGGQNRIVYDQASGRLWFDDDGNGTDPAVLFAVLDNRPALTSADFIVV
ncbi:hypothetical protein [Tsuneonella sp. HG222]